MAFLNEMKGRFAQAGQAAVQKTKDLTEITKFNGIISENERKINDLYAEIGYEVYRCYAENPLPEVADKIEQVKDLHNSVEMCKERIKAINNASLCPVCGAKVESGMMFCSECGTRLSGQESAAQSEEIRCKKCGTVLKEGMAFCISCGTKVEKDV